MTIHFTSDAAVAIGLLGLFKNYFVLVVRDTRVDFE